MNEAFKRQYTPYLEEQVDTSAKGELKRCLTESVKNINQYDLRLVENALQSAIESLHPDNSWWEVTSCNITESLFNDGVEATINTIVEGIKDEEECADGNCEQLNEISNPEKTMSKIDKNLAKVVDKDMVRDLTLIIENDGDVYRRFTTPVIANLKRKKAKGTFDDKLAIQAFVHVVENALRQPYFYRYYSYNIKSVPVSVRYAVAKELLDGAMDEIEFEEVLQNSDPKKSRLVEEPIYDLDTQYDSRKSFYSKAKVDTGDNGDKNKLYSYNTLVAEIVDGKPVVHGTYSATTLRHIKEWLKQLGYRADSAKQIMQDYGVTNESLTESRFDDMEPDVWDRDDEEFPDSLTAYDTAHVDIADRIRRKGVIGGYSNTDHMTPIDSDSSRIVADKKRAERIRRKKELLGV